jgi:hypothetical protein
MEELKDLIATVVAYLARRDREEAAEYENYAYVPVRVAVPVDDERDYSNNSVSWRMY